MRKRIALISASFMVAVSMQSVQAQTQSQEYVVSQDEVRNQSEARVNELNEAVPLDLYNDQKNKLVNAMIAYSNAQVALQQEYEDASYDMEMAFQKTINDILDREQRDSLENYLRTIQEEYEQMYEENARIAREDWEAEMQRRSQQSQD